MSASLVQEVFGQKPDLYAVIGVEKGATAAQIKKAYFKKALLWHPDKAGDDPLATKKFQSLSYIHAVLSDKEKRKEYDRTGNIDDVGEDGPDGESFDAWQKYWRSMFPVVTEEQIEQVLSEYRGSEEETRDVLKWYAECKGGMDDMLTCIIGAREEDVERYVALVHAALKRGAVLAHKAFTQLYGAGEKPAGRASQAAAKASAAARSSRAAGEAAEAEAVLEELRAAHSKKHGGGGAGGGGAGKPTLEDMILARRRDREGDFASSVAALEAKYGGGGVGTGKARGRPALEDGPGGGGGGASRSPAKRKR